MLKENNELNVLSVLIVGCGDIAGIFDKGRESADHPYTHAGAYMRDSRFKITACVEPDKDRRTDFMRNWNIQFGFASIDEMLNLDYQFDVISVCSPVISHLYDVETALLLNPKLIFCEKPITPSLPDTERLIAACKAANTMIAVNHTRRWDPSISELQTKMLSGQMGKLRSIIGLYNKGILNNGSHMLDLLHFLIGPMKVICVGRPTNDYFSDDPTVPVWLEDERETPIHIACAHAEDYSAFELQFIFSLGVLVMEEGGMHWRERLPVHSSTFKGYQKLDDGVKSIGGYSQSMLKAVDNIYRAIAEGDTLASNGDSALLAQRVCEKRRQLAQT